MNIQGYQTVSGLTNSNSMPVGDQKSVTNGGENFASMLKAYTEQVNHDTKAAAKAGESLAAGESLNTSETLLAIQKASLSFEMMLGVRNKLVDAYREVIRMQV
ncbi:flagellar hook-basal body complex protein FliE [Mariprofundus micogutta]|uniref:Flagellar hook-basal body complex protein FliE n=1 Tax=Mariprofundus micogutta TaxID=1921010 RepID=A0A1L8CM57_9PROT|nr:flagellar hook-basal body complex protein FliE [Mariprofundus micogutta]GAV20010.1 flagellar hook-basal body complex protein FliE [Mariprofundus micogutta]